MLREALVCAIYFFDDDAMERAARSEERRICCLPTDDFRIAKVTWDFDRNLRVATCDIDLRFLNVFLDTKTGLAQSLANSLRQAANDIEESC